MSLKRIEVPIAAQAIIQFLTAIPSGAWFTFSNVRLQGRALDKPADSKMNPDKQAAGFRGIGDNLDENGNQTDIACFVESPAVAFREDNDGNIVRGTNYLRVVFHGSIAEEAKRKAMAWETVSIFGQVETTRNPETKVVSQRYTALYLTNGTETVSAQLPSRESKTVFVQPEAKGSKQATA